MRKEVVWAIAAGIIFGLVIGFGVYRINSSLRSKNNSASASPTPRPETPSELKITLDKPENEDVVTSNSVNVSGITKSLAWVIVTGENGDFITQADAKGIFNQDVDLNAGVNQIKITAFDKNGEQSDARVIIVYSGLFKKNAAPASSPLGSPASGDAAIRLKVEEKVAEAINHPKAFLGTVTDITDSTIQIKSIEGDIRQISATADSATVVDSRNDANKEVKLTDIAIGDFLVAMGYKGSNNVLIAQRILITDAVKIPKIDSVYGKVTGKNAGTLTITPAKGEATTLTPNYLTDIETLKDGKEVAILPEKISEGDVVIFVMDNGGKTPKLRSIFLIQKGQS